MLSGQLSYPYNVMWHEMTIGAVLRLVSASLIAFVLSFTIAMAVGYYIPEVYNRPSIPPAPGTIYTLQELKKANEDAKVAERELRRQWRSQSPREVQREFWNHALWETWVPWLLLPLLVRLKTLLHFAVVAAIPIVGALLFLVPPEGLLVIVIALTAGVLLREPITRRKHAT